MCLFLFFFFLVFKAWLFPRCFGGLSHFTCFGGLRCCLSFNPPRFLAYAKHCRCALRTPGSPCTNPQQTPPPSKRRQAARSEVPSVVVVSFRFSVGAASGRGHARGRGIKRMGSGSVSAPQSQKRAMGPLKHPRNPPSIRPPQTHTLSSSIHPSFFFFNRSAYSLSSVRFLIHTL